MSSTNATPCVVQDTLQSVEVHWNAAGETSACVIYMGVLTAPQQEVAFPKPSPCPCIGLLSVDPWVASEGQILFSDY